MENLKDLKNVKVKDLDKKVYLSAAFTAAVNAGIEPEKILDMTIGELSAHGLAYVSSDGKVFFSRSACEQYDRQLKEAKAREEIEVLRIPELEDICPLSTNIDGPCHEDLSFSWYKIDTEENLALLARAYPDINLMFEPKVPDVICVEYTPEEHYYSEYWGYSFRQMKVDTTKFFDTMSAANLDLTGLTLPEKVEEDIFRKVRKRYYIDTCEAWLSNLYNIDDAPEDVINAIVDEFIDKHECNIDEDSQWQNIIERHRRDFYDK